MGGEKKTQTKPGRNLSIQESSKLSILYKIRGFIQTGRDLWMSVVQSRSTMNSDWDSLGFVLLGLEILHGRRFDQLSEQSIPVLDYPYNSLFP